ncbi:MAG: dihydroorotate dehydrogenase [Spirochaetes bacterium]|nr:dihydroorotate dehydrogenase [Spirochaetota bacterium]
MIYSKQRGNSLINLNTKIGNLILDNPFIAASGTCGYGIEYADLMPPEKWGALVLKTVTPKERVGNKPPRCCETDSGMLNSIGLANCGIDQFIEKKLPEFAAKSPTAKAVVSIAGETIEEFVFLAEKLAKKDTTSHGRAGVSAIELNFSCPNVAKGGIHFGADTLSAKEAVKECRKTTRLPLWVKISPATPDPVAIASICMESGADAIVATNTVPGMVIDIWKEKPLLGNIFGGLSGPAIFPISLRVAYLIAKAIPGIPLIGCGGADNAEKAIQFILAGCSAVQVGTAVFRSPDLLYKLLDETRLYMEKKGCTKISSFVGKAL